MGIKFFKNKKLWGTEKLENVVLKCGGIYNKKGKRIINLDDYNIQD